MEFLLTYGWAILIVVVGISAMSYFGMFDTVGLAFQPNQCTIDVGLTCLDHRIEYWTDPTDDNVHANHLYIRLVNNRGDRLRVSWAQLLDEYEQIQPYVPPALVLTNDEEVTVEIQDITKTFTGGNPVMPAGTRYNKQFVIEVENLASGLTHQYKGTITGKVD